MLKLSATRRYLKDLRLVERRNLPRPELEAAIRLLLDGETLPAKYRDHALHGKWAGCRECHIRPDWLLVYRIDRQVLTLVLIRTGTHTDIFE